MKNCEECGKLTYCNPCVKCNKQLCRDCSYYLRLDGVKHRANMIDNWFCLEHTFKDGVLEKINLDLDRFKEYIEIRRKYKMLSAYVNGQAKIFEHYYGDKK